MDGIGRWGDRSSRAIAGATIGSLSGAVIGGLTGQGLGIVVESADKEMVGFGSWMVFVFCAVFAAPGAAVAGAFGMVCGRALSGAVAGFIAAFLVSIYPGAQLWLYDDTSWPYSCLVTVAALTWSGILAGAFSGWIAYATDSPPSSQVISLCSIPRK